VILTNHFAFSAVLCMRKLTCPRCRQAWEVEAVRAGMKAVCPHCQATITIAAPPVKPSPQTAAAPAVAAPTVPAWAPVAEKPVSVAPVSVAPKSSEAAAVQRHPQAVVAPVVPRPVESSTLSEAARAVPPAGVAESKSPAAAAEGPPYSRTKSKVPLFAAAVGLMIAVGVAAFVWRPWSPNDRDSNDQTAAETPREDDAKPTPTVTVPDAPPTVAVPEAVPAPRDEAVIDEGNNAASVPPELGPSELVPPNAEPTASPPNTATPRPSTTAVPIVTVPQPAPQPRATASTPSQATAAASRLVYDKAPIPAGSEGAEAVSPRTTVRTGQRLHAEFQGKWYDVTVVEGLADGNVRVRWETWGRDIVGNVPRNRLRIPGSTPSAQTP
jgi:hypothetical protein